MSTSPTYVIIGTGGRALGSFVQPLLTEFEGQATIVGFYDINPDRAQVVKDLSGVDAPVFTDFNEMIESTSPDRAIVCSKDSTHAQYVVECLNRGIAVYSEKPLCTTHQQVKDIREAAEQSSQDAFVTHNMRFGANLERMKRLLVDGTIGDVMHIQFIELLDRFHGADYFRRWHRKMDNSGGLMLHKSSHHFDLINWLADSTPVKATGHGRLAFYGKNGPFRGKRCSDCAHTDECDLYADVFKGERARQLYKDVEGTDSYHRDGCVFDEEIDIYDTVNASLTYENGIEASYSLIAYGSYEGIRLYIEGTKGRLELDMVHSTKWAVGHKDSNKESLANDGDNDEGYEELKVRQPYGPSRDETQDIPEGGHGGADPKLRKLIFDTSIEDPLNQRAPLEEGIQAVLVGLAVNKSIENNSAPVDIQTMDLLS